MKSLYKNSINSELYIKQAFAELLKEKNYLDITVSELALKAGVGRGTFYNHYDSIVDVVHAIEDDFKNELDRITKIDNFSIFDVDVYINSIFDYLDLNDLIFKSLFPYIPVNFLNEIKNNLYNKIYSIKELHSYCDCSLEEYQIRIRYFVNGVVDIVMDFYSLKLNNINREELIKIIKNIIKTELYIED